MSLKASIAVRRRRSSCAGTASWPRITRSAPSSIRTSRSSSRARSSGRVDEPAHLHAASRSRNRTARLVVYRVEGGAPNSLFRQGWRKDTLKIGDVVTVSGIRAKAATSMNIGLATITTADGKIFAKGAGGGAAAQQ